MWVYDDHNPASSALNRLVHNICAIFGEVLWVKEEILVSLWSGVLVSPLDVHPKDVNSDIIFGEISISLDHAVSINPVPFAEVEAEVVDGWEGCEP